VPARKPPHRRLWGPLGKGGALCNRRSTAAPVGPPPPSSITHPEVAPATVTCSYIVAGTGGFLAGANRAQRRRSIPPGTMGRVGFDSHIFLPGWQVTRVSPYVRGPFPSKEIRRIPERDDPGPPVVPRGVGDRFGIPNPRKSGSVIGADRQRFCPSCVLLNACNKAERRVGV
jgi:hypothetical protein